MNATTKRDDIVEALALLRKRRAACDRQIIFLSGELKKIDRREITDVQHERHERRKSLAHLILMEGATISEAAKAFSTGGCYARQMLHLHCRRVNPELYYSGFHHNVYADGSENDCEPLLDFLRKNAAGFFN